MNLKHVVNFTLYCELCMTTSKKKYNFKLQVCMDSDSLMVAEVSWPLSETVILKDV